MRRAMKVEIISKETIKPSSPTPLHLRNFKLSIFDQVVPAMYIPVVLLYRRHLSGDHDEEDHIVKFNERSRRLKRALSETLTHFYPLAGKIKDNVSVDCNDDGVDYFEAHVDCLLDDILEQPEPDVLKPLVPVDTTSTEVIVGCQFLVQINLFKCGGIAIGVCFSHILCDAATLSTFLKAWSAAALETGEAIIPDFTAPTLFPAHEDLVLTLKKASDKYLNKRLVFEASKIVALKAKAASTLLPAPSTVEAVSALIWKCAMTAGRSNLKGSINKSYILSQAVNIRKRLMPPLPENTFGNALGCFSIETEGGSESNLETLVGMLRKQMIEFCDCASKLRGENGMSIISEILRKLEYVRKNEGLFEIYSCSSWCRFPLYETDFGWGKPTWVGLVIDAFKNNVMLMNTRDGNGVQAYVCLSKEDMALFERDPDILAFASVNPPSSVLNTAVGGG